ncbi:hypothetical protein [Shewanella colwelliana]|uniref:hypothetical protein n=1 Tax=Shewanella colwelliana TaxID=23 RepID=UPI0022AEA7C0|nr:hypothetical protein [Shewanella colwelliana]MCZ4335901.1 hypothetical protein [Shewanella colwelliana]
MLNKRSATLSSLILFVGIILLTHMSACLLVNSSEIGHQFSHNLTPSQQTTAAQKKEPATYSFYLDYITQYGKQYLNVIPAEVEDINFSSLTLTSTLFFLLFLCAGLPSYKAQKYRTPKKILEFTSLLISWIKPIKGTPS